MADRSAALAKSAGEVVERARAAGADDVWASVTRTHDVEFRVRDGALEQVKDSTSRALHVRLFVAGRYSTSSTTDLRPQSLRGFLADAVALTRALQPDPDRTMPDRALFSGRPDPKRLALADARVRAVSREQRLAWCEAMNARVAGKPDVVSVTSSSRDTRVAGAAASSNGFAGAWEATAAGLSTSVTMRDEGDRRPASWYGTFGRHLGDLGAPEAIADEALQRTRARLGAVQGPTRKARMLVDNLSAGALVRRLLGPAAGSAVQQGRSFWAERLGKRVVSEALTIVDDPLIPRGLGSRLFDGEGIAARRMPVITGGALRSFYLDTYYANKLGARPTTGAPSNQVVTPGPHDFAALLAEADGGVLVTGWLGGNMDPTTGDFSLGIAGHLVEGGAVGAPIGEMNVSGNILELFDNLVALGDDPWLSSSIRAPSMLFHGVQFSGA
jgi:PmbA protein